MDSYCLTHKAQEVGYHPEMILAGRRLNDDMGRYIAYEVVKLMLKKRIHVADANILIMDLTFKENCPDLRNTRVVDIIEEFNNYGSNIEVYDPWADKKKAERLYGVIMIKDLPVNHYDGVVPAVAHNQFADLTGDDFKRIFRVTILLLCIRRVRPAHKKFI